MFGLKSTDDWPELDDAIKSVFDSMTAFTPDSPEYPDLLNHLERLTQLRKKDTPRRVSPETMVTVIGNLLGILVIVAYEERHVMTSKGLGFVMKTK